MRPGLPRLIPSDETARRNQILNRRMAAHCTAAAHHRTVDFNLLLQPFGEIRGCADLPQHFSASSVTNVEFGLDAIPERSAGFAQGKWRLDADCL